MQTETLESPDPATEQKQIEQEAKAIVQKTTTYVIANDDDYAAADQDLIRIADALKKAGEIFDPICEATNKAHKAATGARGAVTDPLKAGREVITKEKSRYLQARQEAQRIEAKRIQDEQDEINRAAQKKLEEDRALLQKQAEDKQIELAASLEAKGEHVAAAAVISQPVFVPPPTPTPIVSRQVYVAPPPPKTAGVSTKNNWKAIFPEDPNERRNALIAIVNAAVKEPERFLPYLDLNEKAINALAKSTNGMGVIPGIKFYNDISTSVRTAK